MIELKNVTKIYTTKETSLKALDNISITFPSKGLISVVGVSGCGKTTLLNVLGGLDNSYEGEIIFNNKSTKDYRSKDFDIYRNENIGFVFQDYNLINTMKVYDNIEVALSLNKISKKDKKDMINKISKRLGIDTILDKKPTELSGGQKQRVAIARAIIKNPKVILADEPTGALDSKNSEEIMKLFKELSKDYLIIMVTHNEILAKNYSDKIITMLDGKIINENVINEINDSDLISKTDIKHTIPTTTLFKISFGNLRTKLVRTLLTILACSIGIVALCLVIIVSNGMGLYMSDVQKQALKTYPIIINSNVDDEEPETEETIYEEYPNDDTIYIKDSKPSYDGHVNTFTNEFMDHIRKMDKDLYTGTSYMGWVKMRILAKNNGNYKWINSYSFMKELNYDHDYINSEYDILTGHLPTDKSELVLVIDKYNCIDRYVLESLGIDTLDLVNFNFNDIIGRTYKMITNDIYFRYVGDHYVRYNYADLDIDDIYNESNFELKITGIVRQKKTAKTKLYGTSILYSPLLTDYMLEVNNNSDIVKAQKENPTIDVFTGKPFEVIEDEYNVETIEYQYEQNLKNFGANYYVTRILIYTDEFENFDKIHDYIDEYNDGQINVNKIRYNDYLKQMTDEFENVMKVITQVLLLFAAISLLVAGIMIIIITYVSVLEQTNQVGILRSLGMRKSDVTNLFIYENVIIGLASGILGVILGTILIKPVLSIIISVMKDADLTSFSVNSLEMNGFNVLLLLVLIIGSVILTVLAGIIPSLIASKKDPVKALRQ